MTDQTATEALTKDQADMQRATEFVTQVLSVAQAMGLTYELALTGVSLLLIGIGAETLVKHGTEPTLGAMGELIVSHAEYTLKLNDELEGKIQRPTLTQTPT